MRRKTADNLSPGDIVTIQGTDYEILSRETAGEGSVSLTVEPLHGGEEQSFSFGSDERFEVVE